MGWWTKTKRVTRRSYRQVARGAVKYGSEIGATIGGSAGAFCGPAAVVCVPAGVFVGGLAGEALARQGRKGLATAGRNVQGWLDNPEGEPPPELLEVAGVASAGTPVEGRTELRDDGGGAFWPLAFVATAAAAAALLIRRRRG